MNNKIKKISQDDFNSLAITVASPEQIESWSYAEVKKPETINYRTQKPERDWLFCEKIFWPVKNWECSCWKYKRIRYKWIICERCWVEITRSIVRRERMAHINLAVPIAHVWYLRSTPSRIWLLLDLPVKVLEQIAYFTSYIVIEIDNGEKVNALSDLENEFKNYKKIVKDDFAKELSNLEKKVSSGEAKSIEIEKLQTKQVEFIEEIENKNSETKKSLESIQVWTILSELEWRDMSMKFGHIFSAWTWAESLRKMLEKIDLGSFAEELSIEMKKSSWQKEKKLIKRVRLIESLKFAWIRPEWMILINLPILPPDIRPMVQLDWWRFATSDLNDLYRRVINRNNRLKRLLAIWAPEVICRNEKRMLQEAIDTLLNNTPRQWKTVFTTWEKRKLRSLSDMLKWKQGRFRQNLLWKRVDYSWRSVIVVWPELHLDQMWMPKEMALKLFKPFVIWQLLQRECTYNIKWAEKMIQNNEKIVWDILEEVIADKFVLLNRAPTLHRLWIQAFKPVLIEWKAIQLHPLVCVAFNADFDWDQMAVHIPLTDEAQKEAREIMNAAKNILKPASGQPIVTPTQDMVLGSYFLTQVFDWKKWEWKSFKDISEAVNTYRQWYADLQAKVKIRVKTDNWIELVDTTIGRAIFNSVLPVESIGYKNYVIKKSEMSDLVNEIFNKCWEDITAKTVDEIKRIWFKFATKSWISISINDLLVPDSKFKKVEEVEKFIWEINDKYRSWLMTDTERYNLVIKTWSSAKGDLTNDMVSNFKQYTENHIYYMIDSWARWNWWQVTQLCWMKWLVTSPSWRTIELPIISNFKEWFTVLEFFNATHWWRKWKSDTALKTAEAWYLTRRLVDAVQDIIVKEDDCWSDKSILITKKDSEIIWEKFENRIYWRTLFNDLKNQQWEIIWEKLSIINHELIDIIVSSEIDSVEVRTVIWCNTWNWVCKACYWVDLSNNKIVESWTPVWIIAAQAIWEPGTQLTMRTFHSWWVASEGWDITQGLTRVEELFESRLPKTPALLSEVSWKVKIQDLHDWRMVSIEETELWTDVYLIVWDFDVIVKKWEQVNEKQVLCKSRFNKNTIKARIEWIIEKITDSNIYIKHSKKETRTYKFKSWEFLKIDNWDFVNKWDPINSWHIDLKQLIEITEIYSAQKYIIKEVQSIYAQQWQVINDKHIEIIVKQMFSKVKVIDIWDSTLLPWEVLDIIKFGKICKELLENWKKVPIAERLLLWLTRLSLATDSWLSAASFQETIRVLVEASTTRRVDELEGLKENVIIGKLIPVWEIYRKRERILKNNISPVGQ